MAILRSKSIPALGSAPMPEEINAQLKKRELIEEKIAESVGRPPADAKEKHMRQAASGVLSGMMTPKQAGQIYNTTQREIQKYVERTFATEEDKYEFIENCMIANTMLALSTFESKYSELSAIDAARAATMFSKNATDIRKARQADFKEPPLRVDLILSLEKTLKTINTTAEVTRLPAPTLND